MTSLLASIDHTRAAFMREILARPHDDAPRLVFADWLEEQGDPLGEFIRVQCAMTLATVHPNGHTRLVNGRANRWMVDETVTCSRSDCKLCRLRERESELWAMHGTAWSDAVPFRFGNGITFRRGFPHTASVDMRTYAGVVCTRMDCFNADGDGPEPECPRCNGIGHIPGIAADLFAARPTLERTGAEAEVTWRAIQNFWFYNAGRLHPSNLHPASEIPEPIWGLIRLPEVVAGRSRIASTIGEANGALNDAIIRYGRIQCREKYEEYRDVWDANGVPVRKMVITKGAK